MPKSLSEKSLEEFDCAELEIFLREIKAERENLYSLIQEQKDEIAHLYKIQALDIFFKSNGLLEFKRSINSKHF